MELQTIDRQELCKRLLTARVKKSNISKVKIVGELYELNMAGVGFDNVDFSSARLSLTNFESAVFYDCVFDGLIIYSTAFTDAHFYRCSFRNTSFTGIELSESVFNECDLTNARFRSCSLDNVIFTYGDLTDANFTNSQMFGIEIGASTIVKNTQNLPPIACPEKGSFTAFKTLIDGNGDQVIAELLIPENAERCSAATKKCRASEAKVIHLYNAKTGETVDDIKAYSTYTPSFEYEVGKTVKPKWGFDRNRWRECASGIHFFLTYQEALNYGRF